MRAVVRDIWIALNEPWEGGVPCLYNDRRGMTTVAYGNLCNTPGEAAALPLRHPGGIAATTAEKIAAWHTVHNDPRCAEGGWRYASTLSPLRLTREDMVALALRRLDSNDRILLARLPDFEELNACAQCALHSLAWACGANAHYPRLFADVANRDYEGAAVEIHMNEWTPEGTHNKGLIPRNIANKILMRNASYIETHHLDPDTLDWTHMLEVTEAETQPNLSNPASEPTICVSPTIHVSPDMYRLEDDPDDVA